MGVRVPLIKIHNAPLCAITMSQPRLLKLGDLKNQQPFFYGVGFGGLIYLFSPR